MNMASEKGRCGNETKDDLVLGSALHNQGSLIRVSPLSSFHNRGAESAFRFHNLDIAFFLDDTFPLLQFQSTQ